MPDRAFERLHRVTDLFVTGRELLLADDGVNDPVLLWIRKPNTFELADIQRDAGAARARRLATLTDDTDDVRAVRQRLAGMKHEAIVEEALAPERATTFLAAADDVQADPEWTEKLELLRRDPGLESEPTDEERQALTDLNEEYRQALDAAAAKRLDDARKDLEALSEEELAAKYVEVWRDQVARSAWSAEYVRCEVFTAARDCTAVRDGNGGYDHKACTHPRFIPSRAAVYDLPDEVIERIQQVISDLKMTPVDAGNSAAPLSSSAPAERPSKAEESSPSTPAAT